MAKNRMHAGRVLFCAWVSFTTTFNMHHVRITYPRHVRAAYSTHTHCLCTHARCREWRTVELKRRFSSCGPKECPPAAEPTGGCCASTRHDECCAGECRLSHVAERSTDQDSQGCHSLGGAARSPPPRHSSWVLDVELGYVTQWKGGLHLRLACFVYIILLFLY